VGTVADDVAFCYRSNLAVSHCIAAGRCNCGSALLATAPEPAPAAESDVTLTEADLRDLANIIAPGGYVAVNPDGFSADLLRRIVSRHRPAHHAESGTLTEAERRTLEQVEDSGDTQGLAWRVQQMLADRLAAQHADLTARLAEVDRLHTGLHSCRGGTYYADNDPGYKGNVAQPGPCPTAAAVRAALGADHG
jgi:hypothetical protein